MQYKTTIHKKFGKKGSMTFNMIMMIPKLIFLTIVLLSVVILVSLFMTMSPGVNYKESDLFTLELLYSPHGISYYDTDLNRVLPGVIDEQELMRDTTEERLHSSFYFGEPNEHISARIRFLDKDYNIFKTIYYNQGEGKTYGFKFWEPLAQRQGKGAPYYFIRTMPAFLRKEIAQQVSLSPITISIEVLKKKK